MYAIEPNRYTGAWRSLGASIRPEAILCVSAHWQTRGTAVTAMSHPRTIHDFGGFPQALFEVQYPAPGSPALARRIQQLLAPIAVHLDEDETQGWGLDHGAWSVLKYAFPKADIPVVQLSIDATQPPEWHYALARRLTPLRGEGILITGSGNIVHNLRRLRWTENTPPYDWAQRFSDHVRNHLIAGNHAVLIDYLSAGEDARLSVPTPDHYLPLLYVIAQQQAGETAGFAVEGIEMGAIDMATVVVGGEGETS